MLLEMMKPIRDSKFLFPPRDILQDPNQAMHKFGSVDSKSVYCYDYYVWFEVYMNEQI